jgi:hypothetical protein
MGSAVQWCGTVLCGVVQCGVVWCGVMWCSVVWCGVVWCGVVWNKFLFSLLASCVILGKLPNLLAYYNK